MVWKFSITTLSDFPCIGTIIITHVRNCVMGATPLDFPSKINVETSCKLCERMHHSGQSLKVHNKLLYFLLNNLNICCGYSKELS